MEEKKRKVALVTGAAWGIGRAIARRLASEGYDTVVHYYQEVDVVNEVLEQLRKIGVNVAAIQANFEDPLSVEDIVPFVIKNMGRIDVVVNNSGVTWMKPFLETTAQDLDRLYNVNFRAGWIVAHAAAVAMTRQGDGGSIVNVTSIHQDRSSVGDSIYGSFKAAMARATESMALELGQYGIRVNAVAPGRIQLPERGTGTDAPATVIPLERPGTVEDVASAVAWLVGEGSAYVTGHVLRVDGGFRVPLPQVVGPHGLHFI